MNQDRPGPDPDRLIVAGLVGAAQRHARWGGLSEAEKAAAVAEILQIAGQRPDLLAEVAGILLGASEGKSPHDQAKAAAAAELCHLAGADETLVSPWIDEGRRRAAMAALMPHSGRARDHRA